MSYDKQVEDQMRLSINHINKEEFLLLYFRTHIKAITKKSIRSGFAATGLVPFDQKRVLSTLDLVVRTPSPVPTEESVWESKTPRNLTKVKCQAKYIPDQRRLYTNTSRSPTENAFKQLLKAFEVAVHKRAILQVKNAAVRLEN